MGAGGDEVAWSTWLISDIKQANDRPHYGEPQPQMGQDARQQRKHWGAIIYRLPTREREGAIFTFPWLYSALLAHKHTRAINHVRCVKKAAAEGAT